jgi:hypothetical protein
MTCPHCGSVFEGSGISVQFCPTCGKRVDLDPTGGPVESEPFLQTMKGVLFEPDRFWSGVSPTGTLWDALSFGWVTTALGMLISLPITLLQSRGQQAQIDQAMAKMQGQIPPELEGIVRSMMGTGASVGLHLGSALLYPVFFFIGAAILHLFCLIVGASRNGFNATARVYGYANAPNLLSGLPCINVLGVIYSLVLEAWGIGKVQQTSYGRAAAAVLLPLIVVCCCAIPALVFGLVALIGAAAK